MLLVERYHPLPPWSPKFNGYHSFNYFFNSYHHIHEHAHIARYITFLPKYPSETLDLQFFFARSLGITLQILLKSLQC